jgi:hypothetical protein
VLSLSPPPSPPAPLEGEPLPDEANGSDDSPGPGAAAGPRAAALTERLPAPRPPKLIPLLVRTVILAVAAILLVYAVLPALLRMA